MSKSSIWPIDMTLLSVTTPGQCWPWNNSNERVLHIPPSSPSDCLASYPSVDIQLYSTVPTNWAFLTFLPMAIRRMWLKQQDLWLQLNKTVVKLRRKLCHEEIIARCFIDGNISRLLITNIWLLFEDQNRYSGFKQQIGYKDEPMVFGGVQEA